MRGRKFSGSSLASDRGNRRLVEQMELEREKDKGAPRGPERAFLVKIVQNERFANHLTREWKKYSGIIEPNNIFVATFLQMERE